MHAEFAKAKNATTTMVNGCGGSTAQSKTRSGRNETYSTVHENREEEKNGKINTSFAVFIKLSSEHTTLAMRIDRYNRYIDGSSLK